MDLPAQRRWARPAAKSYGTALYDSTAQSYLGKALVRRPGVVGVPRLARHGRHAGLRRRYPRAGNAGIGRGPAAAGAVCDPSALDAATPGNTVLECTGDTYKTLAEEETLRSNGGFTLYTADKTYRVKTIAVYYYDPEEQGDGAFDLYGSTDLSDYYDYLTFVAGIRARSLYDTGVEAGRAPVS